MWNFEQLMMEDAGQYRCAECLEYFEKVSHQPLDEDISICTPCNRAITYWWLGCKETENYRHELKRRVIVIDSLNPVRY